VRTSGMLMMVKSMPRSANSEAAQREKDSSAALEETGGEARRAGEYAYGRDVDDVAAFLCNHAGQHAQGHAHGGEVVELHAALEIVKAVEGTLDGAADGAACVIHQDVHPAVLFDELTTERIAALGVGDVHRIGDERQARSLEFAPRVGELFRVAGGDDGFGAGLRQLESGGAAYAAGAAGHQRPGPSRRRNVR